MPVFNKCQFKVFFLFYWPGKDGITKTVNTNYSDLFFSKILPNIACSSSIYGFWRPLWYLQTLLTRVAGNGYPLCELCGPCCSIFIFLCSFLFIIVCLSVLFSSAIALSVILPFTVSDLYPLGIIFILFLLFSYQYTLNYLYIILRVVNV